jgi:hypothetical protein
MRVHSWKALAVFSLFLVSCSSKGPAGPNGGGTSNSISYDTPEIEASIALQGGTANAAQVVLWTTTQAADDAVINLTGPSAFTLSLTHSSDSTSGPDYIAYYNSATGWDYVADKAYTMTVAYGGHTFTATVTSVGNVAFSPSASAMTITWAGGGNENTASAIEVSPTNDYAYTTSVTSPYKIPVSGLADYTAGSYDISMNAEELKTSAFSGAYVGSFFSASDQESTTY